MEWITTKEASKLWGVTMRQVQILCTYVEQDDMREVVDITALNAEIERIVAHEDVFGRSAP